jgi:integrase
MAPTTQRLRRAYYNRDIYPAFKDHRLDEITEVNLRGLCEQVKARGAPGTAVQILGIVRMIFNFAMLEGYTGENPARFVPNTSIAKFTPRNRVLLPAEIGLLYRLMDEMQVNGYYRLAVQLLLLTLARRNELLLAQWSEIDFEQRVWNVPPGRVKATRTRQILLSSQALDILIQLRTIAGNSEYIFPSPLDSFLPMSPACLDKWTYALCRRAQKLNLSLRRFAPSDLRSTAEEHLKQAQFDFEWVELALAREASLQRLHIYESDLHAAPLRHMLQEWANMVDAWVLGKSYVPTLVPPLPITATTQGGT